MELTEERLQRLIGERDGKGRGKAEENQSFCLLSPRFYAETPKTGENLDLFSSLVQQLEKSDEKSMSQIRALRESFTRSSLKAGFTSHRSQKDTIPNFIDFEEMNLSRFDFMRNEVQLPAVITLGMNLEQVEQGDLLERAELLHSQVWGRR